MSNFDSKEEEYFNEYLIELKSNGYIDWFINKAKSYSLGKEVVANYYYDKPKRKGSRVATRVQKEYRLIKSRKYTPDFIIKFTKKAEGVFVFKSGDVVTHEPLFFCNNKRSICYIEIKGSYTKHLTSSITFPDRQAEMLYKYNIYIQKVIPISNNKNNLFANSFTPIIVNSLEVYKVKTKNNKIGDSKLKYKYKSLHEYECEVERKTSAIDRW